MAVKPKFSARDIDRLLRRPVVRRGKRRPGPIAVGQGGIRCPHCGEPIPIQVVIKSIDFSIAAPARKAMKGG